MSQYSQNTVDLGNKNSPWYIMNKMIKPNSIVLDVGCSSGYFDEVLVQKGCVVDGIEINPGDAKKAEKWCRQVIVGNIEQLNLADYINEKYNYIIFADVLEHLVDPATTLKKAALHLKPSGRILFSIPNMAHISLRLQMLTGDFNYQDTGLLDRTHLHFYTREGILDVIKRAGLFLVDMRSTYFNIPESLIDKYLDKVGLKKTPQFLEAMELPEAVTYQYVGTIQKTRPVKVKQVLTSAEKRWQESKDDLIYQQANHIKSLERTVREKDNDIDQVSNHLNAILSSKSWRLARRIASIKPNKRRKK